ncbi:glycosyl hydrolase [Sphingomonas oleivorans]|uniref:Beta-D-glucoside glucohydrolase n=1 Tax=Sphingomonas oleivorans TaxID=1735121 RepID=A0A2T5FUB9_9SPHN|nr:glycoside hydrolase family 3 C-terminal domain-containing protein [Sphingomonas oleivorans]PTQ07876.1 glycosyl hydrolase [Sphingomonas oleivorans]
MGWTISDRELEQLLAQMTTEEKVALVNGRHLWKTAMNYRLNIPEIVMTDGTYGVRYSTDQIEGLTDERDGLDQFLAVVNRRQDDQDDQDAMVGGSKPATCFPNGSAFGCSWDVDLAREFGAALALECQEFGVHLLLGPGINIRRTPLAGRAYEYYSEDPLLSGDLAAALIDGLQSGGVGASLKHFACNNSEIERTTMSSEVDERALREIYLKGFERAIVKSRPWTVMSAYNRLNGVQTAENHWLLTTVLREEWGYDGAVVSDWHGIKDRPASLAAGNDLDMPESASRRAELLAALAEGRVEQAALDQSCRRVLRLIRRARQGERRNARFDRETHHALARRIASESIVLLRNEGDVLPIDPAADLTVAVIGAGAVRPIIQGSGSATTRPTSLDRPLDELRALAGEHVRIEHHLAEDAEGEEAAAAAARTADIVIVFANSDVSADGERADRRTLALAAGQDALIHRLAKANPRTIVVLATPDAVTMPWADEVAAIVETFYAGQGMGHALARILFGLANPSGKLTTSFPRREQDIPGFLTYPGENGRHAYSEGLFVGYRYYDRREIEPLFPFGFGLSYTRFRYSGLRLDRSDIAPGERLTASFEISNVGTRAGAEVAQLYARPLSSRLHRPVRELKGFAKVHLEPGETRTVTIECEGDDLRYFDPARGEWAMDPGEILIEIGASSRDIRLSAPLVAAPGDVRLPPFDLDTQPTILFERPGVRDALVAFLAERLSIGGEAADQLVARTESSFLGIYKTICWFIGDRLPAEDLRRFLIDLSAGTTAAPTTYDTVH